MLVFQGLIATGPLRLLNEGVVGTPVGIYHRRKRRELRSSFFSGSQKGEVWS